MKVMYAEVIFGCVITCLGFLTAILLNITASKAKSGA